MDAQEIHNLQESYLDVYQELDEISKELAGRVVNARIARTGRAFDREMEDRTPENMRDTMKASAKEAGAKRLAAGVRRRRNAKNEEVETWVNSLIDEGYDLSEYTWEDMYEMYVTEGRNTSLSALSQESQRRREDKERGRPETEAEKHGRLALGDFRPGASREERARGGRQRLKDRGKVPQKGGKDMFEHVLEYLVAEGYADTNKSALAIMANMSEEWRQSIVEGGFNSSGRYDVGGGRTVGPVAGAVRSLFSGNLPKGQTYVPPSPQKGTNRPPAVPSSKNDSGKLTDFGAGGGKAKLKTGMSVGQVERQGRMNRGDYSG